MTIVTPPRASAKQVAVHQSLVALGYRPRLEKWVTDNNGKKQEIDIALEDIKVAVEYDGIYWHGSDAGVARDKEKSEALIRCGWKVIRMRECSLSTYLPPLAINSDQYCEMVCSSDAQGENYDLDIKKLHLAIQRLSADLQGKELINSRADLDRTEGMQTTFLKSNKDLAEVLFNARIASGITQKEAASKVNSHRSYLSRVENGEVDIAYLQKAFKLLELYGVTLKVSYDASRNAAQS